MRTWRLDDNEKSAWNRTYEFLRRRVNTRLVAFLERNTCAGDTLEAGSGTAYAASLIARHRGVRLSVCMDLDHDALVVARNRDPSLAAVVGDLRCMPFADDSFSLVYNSSTVEHLPKPENAVTEMARVCKTSGHVFVGVPYVAGPLFFQPIVAQTTFGKWLGTVFTRGRLENMLRVSGLTPVSHIRYFLRFFIGSLATKREKRIVSQ